MKKALLLVCTLLLIGSSPALAVIEVTGDVYAGVFDKYLWRGADFSGGKPVAQGGMNLAIGNFSLGYWTNVQLESGEGDETDLTIDYAIPVCESATINLGNIFYMVDENEDPADPENNGNADTNELYLGVTANTLLSPTVKAYYDYDEFKDDRFYTADISHAIELASVTLNVGALASYADNDSAHEPWNAELTARLDIPINEQILVNPTFLYSTPLGDDAKEALDDEMAGGITVTLSF